jgi:hypothetical protein
MKRPKIETFASPSRLRLVQLLIGVVFLYMLFMSFEIPLVFRARAGQGPDDGAFEFLGESFPRVLGLEREEEPADEDAPAYRTPERQMREFRKVSGLVFNESLFDGNAGKDEFLQLHKAAKHAWVVGKTKPENVSERCPHSISLTGSQFRDRRNRLLVVPCGLTLGSHITVVGTPRWAHSEYDPKISVLKEGDESVMVSQFMIELQGLKTVDGEDPPKILHFNPGLKGDWSGKPVIEQNTCYRMQRSNGFFC